MFHISFHDLTTVLVFGYGLATVLCTENNGDSCSTVDHDSSTLFQSRALPTAGAYKDDVVAPEGLDFSATVIHKRRNAPKKLTIKQEMDGDSIAANWHDLSGFVFDFTWTSMLVFLPCVLLGVVFLWAWLQLDEIKVDEVWTAQDENLREVDISLIGASGVALLRKPSDRQFGISLSFAGIMLQIVFLYFIAVSSVRLQGVSKTIASYDQAAPGPLLFCSMFFNSMTCCANFASGVKAWETSAPVGYENIHHALVFLDSFLIPSVAIVIGSIYLWSSTTISGLVFNATAMAFVCRINMQIAGLMSWSLSAHGGRAFQPARVCIKDSVNTVQYAYYSLIGSALVAMAMMPVAIIFRHIF
jgi:hypothetical protein